MSFVSVTENDGITIVKMKRVVNAGLKLYRVAVENCTTHTQTALDSRPLLFATREYQR